MNKVNRLLEIEKNLYDIRNRWIFGNYLMRSQAEQEGALLNQERRTLLKELTQEEKDQYYSPQYFNGLHLVKQ